jgi:Spy/CpxP family protein refolding chaperone
MTRFSRTLAMAVMCACLASVAAAQTQSPGQQAGAPRQPGSGPGPGGGPGGARPSEQQREEVRKKIEAVRLARLTEELQLDEKTAAKFIPVITVIDQKRRAMTKENQETMREIKIMLHSTPPDEAKLKAAISAIEKNRREIVSLRDKEFNTVRDSLTVTQMAHYLLFNQEFQQEMRGMMEGARNPRRQGMGPGPGRPPGKGTPTPQQP